MKHVVEKTSEKIFDYVLWDALTFLVNFTMANVTKYEIYETIQFVSCTASVQENQYLFSLSALNILLAITASLGNAVVFFALRRNSSIQPPSKLLFQCLVVTDFCVGVFAQPLFVVQLLSIANQRLQVCYEVVSINDIAGTTLSGVSFYTLTAISLDRLLALCLGLRYKLVVTLWRTRKMTICVWLINISTFILRRYWKYALISKVISAVIYSFLTISAFSYLTIYIKLRKSRNQVQDFVQQGQPNERRNALNIAKYRKTVYTALYVQFALVTCYLPFGIVSTLGLIYTRKHNQSLNIFVRLAVTLAFLNSSLNPILYCWRIRGVSQAVKDIIRHLCHLSH